MLEISDYNEFEDNLIDKLDKDILKDRIKDVLNTLSEKEKLVLELRFGLNGKKEHTLLDTGRLLGKYGFNSVNKERVRQIEAKALRKLRHPSRIVFLKKPKKAIDINIFELQKKAIDEHNKRFRFNKDCIKNAISPQTSIPAYDTVSKTYGKIFENLNGEYVFSKELYFYYDNILLTDDDIKEKEEIIKLGKFLTYSERNYYIMDVFIEDGKNKFMKGLAPIEKSYDYYMGVIIDDLRDDKKIQECCKEIYEKSEKNLRLIKICEIDDKKLLIFEFKSEFVKPRVNGIVASISKYLCVKKYELKYIHTLQTLCFDSWDNQKYFKIVDGKKEYELKYE